MFYSKKFKKFNNIKHCFFSRRGGFSKGIYQSLNCGIGSKDNKKNDNRNLFFVSKKMKINHKLLIKKLNRMEKLTRKQIEDLLPHREPMLLIDERMALF